MMTVFLSRCGYIGPIPPVQLVDLAKDIDHFDFRRLHLNQLTIKAYVTEMLGMCDILIKLH